MAEEISKLLAARSLARVMASEVETICDLWGGDKAVQTLRETLDNYLRADPPADWQSWERLRR